MIRVIDKNGNIKVKQTVVSASGSAPTSAAYTSLINRVSTNSAQMVSADNAISNAVSIVSAQVGVNSAQMTSADTALYQAVSVLSQQVSALSQVVSTKNTKITIQNQGSNTVSNPSTVNFYGNTVSTLLSAGITKINISTTGGSGSVASADFVSLRSVVQANSAQMTSADNAISNAVSIVSAAVVQEASVRSVQAISIMSAVSVNSAQMTSADNAISNAVSIVSAAQAVTSAAVTSVNNRISAVSADLTSFKQSINNFGDVSTSSPVSTQVLRYVSATGQWTNQTITGGSGSVTSANFVSLRSVVQANSAQMTSADNAISNAVSIVSAAQAATSAAVTSVNQSISVISQQVSALSANVAIISLNTSAMSTRIDVLSQQLSIISAIGGIVSLQNVDGSAVSAGAPVYEFTSAATFKRANASAATTKKVIGLVIDANIAVSAVGRVQTMGLVTLTTAQWDSITGQVGGLTPGTQYYLDNTTGLLAITTPATGVSRPVGIAISTTVMQLQLGGVDDLTSAVLANSAQMTSADNAISNAVSIVSVAQATTSAAVTSVNQIVSVISQQVSALSANVATISLNVSAMSTKLSNTTSAVQANSAQMTSADNAISNAVSIVSAAVVQEASVRSVQAVSIMSAVSVNSAQMTSADNAISNAVSIVSVAQAATSAAVTSVNNRISGVSADLTSFKASLNNFGDVSISTPTDGQVLMYNASAGQWFNSTAPGGTASVTSAEYASTVSIVSTIQWPAIETVTSAVYSVVEADRGKIKYFNNAASIEVVLPNGLTSGFQAMIYRASAAGLLRFSATTTLEAQGSALNDAKTAATIIHKGGNEWLALGAFLPAELGTLSNQISVLSQAVSVLSQAVSVLSNTVSAISARMDGLSQAVSVVSQSLSVLSQSVSVLSQAVSVISAGLGGLQIKVVGDSQGISATTLGSANSRISGLSISCAAGAVYKLEGMIMLSISAGTQHRLALSTSATTFKHAAGFWDGMISIGPAFNASTQAYQGRWNQGSFGSVSYSAVAGTAGVVYGIKLNGVIATSTTGGTIQIKALASAAAAPLTILQGSYVRAFKIG